jgi:hypothetical protein
MASHIAPKQASDYGDFVAMLARRYGPTGSFWRNPGFLSLGIAPQPVTRWGIWNEPNIPASLCTRDSSQADPATYAKLFVAASDAVHQVDPTARIMVGGLADGNQSMMAPGAFMAAADAAEPDMAADDAAIAVHLYGSSSDRILSKLADFRDQLRAAGIPDSEPIVVNEWGWPTQGLNPPITEDQRAQMFTAVADQMTRSDCNVEEIGPFTWRSAEQNAANPEDWYGITGGGAGGAGIVLYPSAKAYGQEALLYEGKTADVPPTDTVTLCGSSG